MDTVDWRDQFPPARRQRHVCEIISELSLFHPSDDEDISVEIRKIAESLEHKIYADATSEADYSQKVSKKILLILGDSRVQLQPDFRQRIVKKIFEALRRHLPIHGQEGLNEVRTIAKRFEEKIYASTKSQPDYLQKIYLKTRRLQ